MQIQQLLSQTPEQLREYCESLSGEDKKNLYEQVIEEAKGKRLREMRQLSKIATAVEKSTDKKLLAPFYNDDNPFNTTAILNFFGKLSVRLVLIVHSSAYDKNLRKLNELDELLPDMYEELRPRLTNSMKDYVEKELRFSNFLRDNIDIFRLQEEAEHGSVEKRKKATIELIRLFARQPELNYYGDVFILGFILDHIKVFGKEAKNLESDLSALVDLLDENIKKLEDLENKIEMLAEEGESIEKYRDEKEEIEKELMNKRDKVKEQLCCLRLKNIIFDTTFAY